MRGFEDVIKEKITDDDFIDKESSDIVFDGNNTIIRAMLEAFFKRASADNVLVVLNNEVVGAILSYRNMKKFLDLVREEKAIENNVKIFLEKHDQEFNQKDIVVKKDSSVQDVLDIFKDKKTDVIIVVDNDSRYVGKISRRNFIEKIISMAK